MPLNTSTLGVSIGGTAVVCCVHHVVKRAIVELEFDQRKEKVQLCGCCENLFTTETDVPQRCPQCRPRSLNG